MKVTKQIFKQKHNNIIQSKTKASCQRLHTPKNKTDHPRME